ncbi:MAG: type II toxin-antitoxin system Phd/YefM family antitoxin [Methylibium sp.]|uniref:type II toxin-antitoxin system Phd/YefM family antitoxin n=1 Tax=Methylibium sp. TaxID=2067992 RepID=UPI00182D67B6|nr:type II toxin-antitoxin system Phd/YefM family antitoxin [Methylibium sp.]MBA2722701.1 type II toxin-antitoxin system Phd/YefM family antitoxin [Methylibium sp.]MBA3590062.1 type II toxin-antitoxin system Phd/YefM family antitoxin [Methylibium sp.]MBA3623113.1 type II toxin-antitoxin system Phd/YefM family antitoxin [Methylibium sp.]
MSSWPVQDAKARFSELLRASLAEGPQIVTLRGKEVAVLAPVGEWRRLSESARPGLKALLLAPGAPLDLEIPARGQRQRKAPAAAER